ncbi:TonB-dependent receptor domain-containing protein [Algimonas porphyrae]|uniref:TonB-dependent receptor n=1 Tax=Algimonas porphyrae TaxID=1128113 RepID=A0ABQ5V3I6_9PROT|nr:TonB-dependent receptor [Algimonas porphyrae]GLQ21284.1 TonB-dependent receptor [Algimonas porphyrae]
MTKAQNKFLALLLLGSALSVPELATAQDAAADPTPTSDEVIATGVFIPNEKRITSEITSVLDEEVFAQIGAGDIASALTRVTGLSLNRGKFVIARGLNERYANATLNGSPLPSPEPLRRVAPLDLFPTSVLSDAVVSKTFDPEFSGEFGGAAIALSTKALPDERFLELTVSASANTETSLRKGFLYGGSDTDWLGFDDGLRDLPALDAAGIPTANLESFSTLIVDNEDNIPFNGGFRVSAGDRYDLDGGQSIGVLATLGYDNSWETRRATDNTAVIGANDTLEVRNQFVRTSTENSIALNGLLTVGVEFDPDNTVEVVGLMTRQSSAEARVVAGLNRDGDPVRNDFTEWFEREVYLGQVFGEHFLSGFNDAQISWRAMYAQAGREAPYERFVGYIDEPGDADGFVFEVARFGQSNNRTNFSQLDDETIDAGLDFEIPFDLTDREVTLKLGGAYLDKSRDTEEISYFYEPGQASNRADLLLFRTARIDQLFSDTLFDANFTTISSAGSVGFPRVSDTGLEVMAGYASLESEITRDLRVSAGFRYEDSTQTTLVRQTPFSTQEFRFDDLEDSYALPAATLTYTFGDWQMRLAASKTINRPQFRELTPSEFRNTETEDIFIGNPFLQNSEAINLDGRLEYYFGANQFITIGGFYKDLTNPIEEFVFDEADGNITTSFLNAPSAEVFGLELEFEKTFAIPANIPLFENLMGGQDFVVRSNYTYVDSSVSADGTVNILSNSAANLSQISAPNVVNAAGLYTDGRRLQGQSDHLANVQIGVKNVDAGWDAFLLLNYSSDRIRVVESLSDRAPAVIEQLPLSLDLVVNVPFDMGGGDYEFGFKVQNILDDDYKATQEAGGTEIVIDGYDIGTTFSASLKRRF